MNNPKTFSLAKYVIANKHSFHIDNERIDAKENYYNKFGNFQYKNLHKHINNREDIQNLSHISYNLITCSHNISLLTCVHFNFRYLIVHEFLNLHHFHISIHVSHYLVNMFQVFCQEFCSKILLSLISH